jgi:hypothetical protein
MHGYGCYFAYNSHYSDGGVNADYTWTNKETGFKEMIICEVFPGKVTDSNLNLNARKNKMINEFDSYDSHLDKALNN